MTSLHAMMGYLKDRVILMGCIRKHAADSLRFSLSAFVT